MVYYRSVLRFLQACCATLMLLGVLTSSPAAEATQVGRTVYRCSVNGITTFSDTACATDAQVYEMNTSRISTYSPARVPANQSKAPASKPKRARKNGSIAAEQARHAAECTKLAASLRDVRSRMRAGYDAKQGERLRERRKQLDDRRRTAGCS